MRARWVLSVVVFSAGIALIEDEKGPFTAVVTAVVSILIVFALWRARRR